MNIAPTGTDPVTSPAGSRSADAVAQFDVMFYRMLLQSATWTSGGAKGHGAEQALFGDMVTGFLAEAAARQQQGFGAMLFNGMAQQGKPTT